MAGTGDADVQGYLERVRRLYDDAGAIAFVREVVAQTWRANRGRWSPDVHFDDTNTLGHQTSRNVNNRIYRTIVASDVAPVVHAETEPGVVILELAGMRLRVVKAPIDAGLVPDFDAHFDWSTSSTRESAARRNSRNYYPLLADGLTLEFEDDPRPVHRRNVEACRDFFLLWAAELHSNRTAGWLGLPRLGDLPWMGVLPLWMDEPTADGVSSEPDFIVEDEDADDL